MAWIALLAAVGVPLAVPLLDLLARQDRLFLLAGNTLLLVIGTWSLALPLGTLAATLLYRTDLPFHRCFRFLTVLSLFVPLSLVTTAWQATLGAGGWFPLTQWGNSSGRPWAEGLGPAIWIHAQAALPWVIVIIGQGLRWVEPELEEDALLVIGPWRVLWSVTLPRCWGAIVAAAIWVGLQVSTELTVADLMLVRTFAEEVYAQFWVAGDEALARAVTVSLPFVLLSSLGVYVALCRLERVLPTLGAPLACPRRMTLGWQRWPCFALVLGGVGLLAGVPLLSLLWKTGWAGHPAGWSAAATLDRLAVTLKGDGSLVRESLLTAFVSAAFIATVALTLCWLALDAPRFRRALFILIAVAWSLPGPIVGIGLKETIMKLVVWLPLQPLSDLLYSQPSPVPVIWAHLVRFLPCAVVALWPGVRLLPRELRDSLKVDGAAPLQEFCHLVVPLTWRAWLAVVVVIAALALGEIGAVAMRVETPGWETFAHVLFNRMHYGSQHDVAALCLVLLLHVAAGGAVIAALSTGWRLWRDARSRSGL
jgi:iron(III) transport system permease protein